MGEGYLGVVWRVKSRFLGQSGIWIETVYLFPVVAITNDQKLSGGNNTKLSHSSGGQSQKEVSLG